MEEMTARIVETPKTMIEVGVDYKHNLQNFENGTFYVKIADTLRPNESIDDGFERVANKVLEKFAQNAEAVFSALKGMQQ